MLSVCKIERERLLPLPCHWGPFPMFLGTGGYLYGMFSSPWDLLHGLYPGGPDSALQAPPLRAQRGPSSSTSAWGLLAWLCLCCGRLGWSQFFHFHQ